MNVFSINYNSSLILLLLLLSSTSNAGFLKSEKINIDKYVDNSNIGLFNSPIFTYKNAIYVAFVNKTITGSYNTSIGKWTKKDGWLFTVIEPNSMNNPYHGQPSIAVDTDGFIHITYNMHSSPWQYSISKYPEDITEWIFKGQKLNGPHEDIKSTVAAGDGTAAIPGNRITYQFMTTDQNGQIYISYREALKNNPKVKYGNKQWSLGISKYNANLKKWSRAGKNNPNMPLATEPKYRAQVGHITFDNKNRMHVVWNWHVEYSLGPGDKKNTISYAYSDDNGDTFNKSDGTQLKLPIRRHNSDIITKPDFFYSYTKVSTDNNGTPYVSLMPKTMANRDRSLIFYKNGQWSSEIKLPYGGTNFYFDKNNILTTVSSGLRIHRSINNGKRWKTYSINNIETKNTIWLDNNYIKETGQLRFLAQNIENNTLTVYTVSFISN